MRYVLEVTVDSDDAKQSLELSSLPPIPLTGDTVALQNGDQSAYGIVRHRHFEFVSADVCRISLVCIPDNG